MQYHRKSESNIVIKLILATLYINIYEHIKWHNGIFGCRTFTLSLWADHLPFLSTPAMLMLLD